MAKTSIYRKASMDRIQSPEQLNEYLRVTNPTVWVLLAAVIILLAGVFVWGFFTHISSFADGVASVENGLMTVSFNDDAAARNVNAGMDVTVGNTDSTIKSIGLDADGNLFAVADTVLSDGQYSARVKYKETQIIKLLFN